MTTFSKLTMTDAFKHQLLAGRFAFDSADECFGTPQTWSKCSSCAVRAGCEATVRLRGEGEDIVAPTALALYPGPVPSVDASPQSMYLGFLAPAPARIVPTGVRSTCKWVVPIHADGLATYYRWFVDGVVMVQGELTTPMDLRVGDTLTINDYRVDIEVA